MSYLNDHVVDAVDVELHFGSGIGVAETQLSFGLGDRRQSGNKTVEMKTNATQNLFDLG